MSPITEHFNMFRLLCRIVRVYKRVCQWWIFFFETVTLNEYFYRPICTMQRHFLVYLLYSVVNHLTILWRILLKYRHVKSYHSLFIWIPVKINILLFSKWPKWILYKSGPSNGWVTIFWLYFFRNEMKTR